MEESMSNRTAQYLSVLILSAVVTCAPASETSGKSVDPIMNLQLEKLLLEFETMENGALADINLPSVDQIVTLRHSLQEVQEHLANCTVQVSTASSAPVQMAQPSGPVEPNTTPPSQEEIAKMQNATVQSHLPGPTIKKGQPVTPSTHHTVENSQPLETAIEQLDLVERDLSGAQPDKLGILNMLRQVRLNLEKTQKDIECPD